MDRPLIRAPLDHVNQGWSASEIDVTPSKSPKLLTQAIVFLMTFSLLQIGWMSVKETVIEHLVIDIATVQPATALINQLVPNAHAQAVNSRITSPGGGINILAGCEGTEVLFLLLAAIWSFPMSWRRRILGSIVGTILVYGMNLGRILALFMALRTDRSTFDLLHGFVAPIILIAMSSLFFLIWISFEPKSYTKA